MTYSEILMGRVLLEGYNFHDYDYIISGERPILPSFVDPLVKEMTKSCWNLDLQQTPTFDDVVKYLNFKRN